MKHWIALGMATLAVSISATAEQGPAQPPAPPQVGVAAQGPSRAESRHHDMRAFEFRMNGPDDAARILPPGPWWKDGDLAKRIDLSADQQKRIEDTFLQSKIELIHLHASLEEQEVLLAPLLDANPIDQGKALAQISKIADTRANLEKANARMLLQIRGVLNQQQWTKLQQERPGMRPHNFTRTPDGPHSFAVPDPESMRMELEKTPPVDAEKLKVQVLAALHSMPALDADALRVRVPTALKDLPRLNAVQGLEAMPPVPAEILIQPTPLP